MDTLKTLLESGTIETFIDGSYSSLLRLDIKLENELFNLQLMELRELGMIFNEAEGASAQPPPENPPPPPANTQAVQTTNTQNQGSQQNQNNATPPTNDANNKNKVSFSQRLKVFWEKVKGSYYRGIVGRLHKSREEDTVIEH
jgi:hypothetical protein